MDQEDLDFIVDDGYDHDVDPTYEPNDEDSNEDKEEDEDVFLSECDEDSNEDKEEDEDVFLSECDDNGVNEDLDYVTVDIPLPFKFDEAWFEKFQIMNLMRHGLKNSKL